MLTYVCCCGQKMSETRRPLGSLAGEVNVGGEDSLRRRVGPERTPIERYTMSMYARREEAWRPLTRQRVAAFLRLLILCFLETENGRPLQSVSHLQVVKEGATEKDNPLDSQPLGLDDAGEVLAHHTGTIQRSERLLGRPLAARAER